MLVVSREEGGEDGRTGQRCYVASHDDDNEGSHSEKQSRERSWHDSRLDCSTPHGDPRVSVWVGARGCGCLREYVWVGSEEGGATKE